MAVLQHEGTIEILYRDFAMPTGARFTTGYLARPDRIGAYPLVVLLPPLRGITPFIKDLARRLARNRYAVLVPDLTRGAHPGPDAPFEDLVAAYRGVAGAAYPGGHRRRDRLRLQRLGGMGAGRGRSASSGSMSADASRSPTRRTASARWAPSALRMPRWQGDEDRDLQVADALEMLPMAVLGLYGAEDELVPAAGVDEAQRRNPHGKWILYEGIGHDFLDDDSGSYHSGAAGDTLARLLALLAATLG